MYVVQGGGMWMMILELGLGSAVYILMNGIGFGCLVTLVGWGDGAI